MLLERETKVYPVKRGPRLLTALELSIPPIYLLLERETKAYPVKRGPRLLTALERSINPSILVTREGDQGLSRQAGTPSTHSTRTKYKKIVIVFSKVDGISILKRRNSIYTQYKKQEQDLDPLLEN